MDLEYIKTYSNCLFIRGFKRSVVADIQLFKSEIISNDFYEIVEELKKGYSIKFLKKKYGKVNEEVVDEYINYIIEKGWGFLASKTELDLFPELSNKIHTPSKITNAIVFRDIYEDFYIKKIILE